MQLRRRVSGRAVLCTLLFLLVSCSAAPPAEPEAPPLDPMAVKDHFFDSNGVRIHYTEQGTGEPVLLAHGFALNISRWDSSGLAAALAQAGYRVFAVDARGHGESGKPQDPESYGAEMPRDLIRLMDHLRIEKAHVVGYSMGALITNRLRDLYPARLQTAVLGGAGWLKPGDVALADMTGPEIAESLERTGDFQHMLRKFTENRQPPATEEEIQTRNARMMEGNDPLALAAVLRAWDGFAVSEEDLRENSVPTLSIVGANDPLKAKVDELQEVMANLEVVVVEGADHGSALTSPEFLQNLVRFLSEHPAS